LAEAKKAEEKAAADADKAKVAAEEQAKLAADQAVKAQKEKEAALAAAAAEAEKQAAQATEVEAAEDEVLTISVSIMPQGDEFELELPAEITGMDIISELIDAEVLNEDMNFAINLKRTGDAIGGDDTLKGMGVKEGDLIVIDTE